MARPGNAIVGVDELGAGDNAGSVLDPESSGIGLGAKAAGIGLSPPPPISTEPMGILAGEAPDGDGVEIAEDAVASAEAVPHDPDAGMPPGGGAPIVIPPPS